MIAWFPITVIMRVKCSLCPAELELMNTSMKTGDRLPYPHRPSGWKSVAGLIDDMLVCPAHEVRVYHRDGWNSRNVDEKRPEMGRAKLPSSPDERA